MINTAKEMVVNGADLLSSSLPHQVRTVSELGAPCSATSPVCYLGKRHEGLWGQPFELYLQPL